MNDLVNRLRGNYSLGKNNEFGVRSFADFIPPISLEAAKRIEELESKIKDISDENDELKKRIQQLENTL